MFIFAFSNRVTCTFLMYCFVSGLKPDPGTDSDIVMAAILVLH